MAAWEMHTGAQSLRELAVSCCIPRKESCPIRRTVSFFITQKSIRVRKTSSCPRALRSRKFRTGSAGRPATGYWLLIRSLPETGTAARATWCPSAGIGRIVSMNTVSVCGRSRDTGIRKRGKTAPHGYWMLPAFFLPAPKRTTVPTGPRS